MKYKFWIKTSRMLDETETVDILDEFLSGLTEKEKEDVIKDYLEDWCVRVFPRFYFTDSYIKYGYEEA